MAKLTATKVKLADGRMLISGYKIALPKVKMEECGFKEGDKLKVDIKKGAIRISHE